MLNILIELWIVVDELESCNHAVGHKATCKSSTEYVFAGFRSTDRKTIMEGVWVDHDKNRVFSHWIRQDGFH